MNFTMSGVFVVPIERLLSHFKDSLARSGGRKLHTTFIEKRACIISRAAFLVEDNPTNWRYFS
jgi:hypothetical protein